VNGSQELPELTGPTKDKQTVTPEGAPVTPGIEGVNMRRLVTQQDERGEICEIFSPAWGVSEKPLVIRVSVRCPSGQVKGWVVHHHQDDRIFANLGVVQWALFDARKESPTTSSYRSSQPGERNRSLFVIPSGVYHAVKNVGIVDAYFINMPTAPYNHADPDKYRLPLKNDLIPFSFERTNG
jgi:dTDP-4-dehydrorhamnose 3,5-epimerase